MIKTTNDSPKAGQRPDLRGFPSTRYQGSKRKIVPWLHDVFTEIEFDSALDLFGGTATVSYLLKRMGKRVAYNDILRCNYLTGVALIENDSVLLDEPFAITTPDRRNSARYDLIRRTFKGFYFTDYENAWLDRAVFTFDSCTGTTTTRRFQQAVGYHALFQSCLVKRPFNMFHRKNLYLRTATVERSFGNKTTWDTPINQMFKRFLRETNRSIFQGTERCTALNCDATAFPNAAYDLVYLDPPYVTGRRDVASADYLANYHFLEGLARYHDWGNAIDHASKILALRHTAPNPFGDPRTNRAALRAVFERFATSKLVVSYKRFGTPSLSWFVRELKRLGKRVSYRTKHYKYALNSQNGDAARNREIIVIGE
jgi:adenine-specific DNA-methyltransferase